MNIRLIKNKADELLMSCRPQVIRHLTLLMLIGLVPSLFSGYNNPVMRLIYFLVSVAFLTFDHGYIVTSLKVVRNNAEALNDDDVFVGFKRWTELFPTYFVSALVQWGVSFIFLLIAMLVMMFFLGSALSQISSIVLSFAIDQNNPYYLIQAIVQYAPSVVYFVFIMAIVDMILSVVVSGLLFAVPYLLEQYQMKTTVALKESFSLMKGHVWEWIKLELSFFGWMILVGLVEAICVEILSFIPILGSLIAAIVAGFAGIYTYMPRYVMSKAVFFEELAYYRYESSTMSEGDMSDE